MKQIVMVIVFGFNFLPGFGQNILSKKLTDIDMYEDYSALETIGLTRDDISFTLLLSSDSTQKNKSVSEYYNNIDFYRGLKDYQILSNISSKSTSYETPFPDSLIIQTDYNKGREKALAEGKPMIVIFVSHLSLPVRILQNSIIYNGFDDIVNKYVVVWLYVDRREINGEKNLKLLKEKYSTDIIPFSVIERNDKVIKTFEGYSLSMIGSYRQFLAQGAINK